MKWQILDNMPSYAPHKQCQIIVACFALHNFIRMSGLVDRYFDHSDCDENYVSPEASTNQPQHCQAPTRDESTMMNAFRDSIVDGLLNRS